MRLPEKTMPRRYNALANDWTPLSRKPCWLSIAFHCLRGYVKRNRLSWFHRLVPSSKIFPTQHKLSFAGDKSFADDLVASGYCKCESNLCVTIHWDFCRVPSICSSLIQLFTYPTSDVAECVHFQFRWIGVFNSVKFRCRRVRSFSIPLNWRFQFR